MRLLVHRVDCFLSEMRRLDHILHSFYVIQFPELFHIHLEESSLKHLLSEHSHIHLRYKAVRENSHHISSASCLIHRRVSHLHKAHLVANSSRRTLLTHDSRVGQQLTELLSAVK